MPICPECEQEFTEVIDQEGKMPDWSTSEVVESSEAEMNFCCPHCGEVLDTWDKAYPEDFTTTLLKLLTR
jgi:hypothetical protein